MNNNRVQINAKEYLDLDYLDKPRWISLWYQINEVVKTKPKTTLEIGIGNGLVTKVLKMLNYQVITLDIDRNVKANKIGDVRKLPFKSNDFDTILCAQVLEHIPYNDFLTALKEMHRVTRKNVILTLPHDYLTYLLFIIKIFPFIKPLTLFFTIPRWEKHTFNGQHYWEIGKKGYSLNRIKQDIIKAGFIINKTYILPENLNHRFFILTKK